MAITRVLDRFEKLIALEAAVLRRQKIHCEVDAGELSARHLKITRRTRAGSNAHGIEFGAQLFDGDVLTNIYSCSKLHSLRLELSKTEIEHRLLQLELRYSVAKQSTDALVLLEHHYLMSEAAKLLRGSEACRS